MRSSISGMTMLEVLMALGILAVAALAVIGIFPTMSRLSKSSMNTTAKLYSAQQKMDELVANNAFISLSATTDYPFSGSGFRTWKGIADPYGSSAVQVIEVEVDWTEGSRSRKVVLHGLVTP